MVTGGSDPSERGGSITLSADEQERILAVLDELQAQPPANDPRPFGCLAALVAVVGLAALPWVGPALGLGTIAARVIGAVLVVVLLFAAFLVVFSGSFVSGHVMARVKEALALLETHGLDLTPDELQRAAVRILWDSSVDVGPTSANTYDRDEARVRLAEAFPYVKEVERFLVARQRLSPVFTLHELNDHER